ASACLMKPMICSSVNLLFLMSVILQVDGLRCHYAGTAGRGQVIYMCLIKQKDWSYEKEWRIIVPLGPSYANAEQPMPKPSAVILGSMTATDDEAVMKELCKAMDIPLRRVAQRPGGFELELVSEKG
ncbi:DUF2971 domain-containing protein, partial [Bordetella genomosp. 11]